MEPETELCGKIAAYCVCVLHPHEDGAHECVCGGSWYYDEYGAFQVVKMPNPWYNEVESE